MDEKYPNPNTRGDKAMNQNELYHYGVKGMKWGVRRDTRILANHRHNTAVRRLEAEYAFGKIGTEQYRRGLKDAKSIKKQTMSDAKKRFDNASDDMERVKMANDISKMTINEVPNANIKRGAAAVNQALGIVNIASVASTAANAAIVNPAFASAYLGAGAVAVAAEVGWRYMTQRYLDKKS